MENEPTTENAKSPTSELLTSSLFELLKYSTNGDLTKEQRGETTISSSYSTTSNSKQTVQEILETATSDVPLSSKQITGTSNNFSLNFTDIGNANFNQAVTTESIKDDTKTAISTSFAEVTGTSGPSNSIDKIDVESTDLVLVHEITRDPVTSDNHKTTADHHITAVTAESTTTAQVLDGETATVQYLTLPTIFNTLANDTVTVSEVSTKCTKYGCFSSSEISLGIDL